MNYIVLDMSTRFGGDLYPVSADDNSQIIFLGIFGGFILLLVLYSFVGGGSDGGAKYSKRNFRKTAYNKGLDKDMVRILFYCIKKYRISSPMTLLNNNGRLDKVLSRLIIDINSSKKNQSEKESQKHQLYMIKQRLEKNATGMKIKSTRSLRSGRIVNIFAEGGFHQVKVMMQGSDKLALTVPKKENGQVININIGSEVFCVIWNEDGDQNKFKTQILGFKKGMKENYLTLKHTEKIIYTKSRKHRRKEIMKPALVTPVIFITEGKKKKIRKKSKELKDKQQKGQIRNISSGGCMLFFRTIYAKGQMLKIEFEPREGSNLTFYGKVIRTKKSGWKGIETHIMFTKGSLRDRNRLNQFMYDF